MICFRFKDLFNMQMHVERKKEERSSSRKHIKLKIRNAYKSVLYDSFQQKFENLCSFF